MTSADTAEQGALSFLTQLIERAQKAGANAADAVAFDGASLSVSHRLGAREDLERSEASDTGLRVFVGKRQAVVSSTDRSDDAIGELVERAVEAIQQAAHTGGIGDGKIFVTSVDEAIRIRTGERGPEAV